MTITDKEMKVIRSTSMVQLKSLMQEAVFDGWKPVGDIDIFNKEYVQTVQKTITLDDTEEITERITDVQ